MGITRQSFALLPDPSDPDYGNLPVNELIALLRRDEKYLWVQRIRSDVCRRLTATGDGPDTVNHPDHALADRLVTARGRDLSLEERETICERLLALEPPKRGRPPTPVRNLQETGFAAALYEMYLAEEQTKARRQGRRHKGARGVSPSEQALERVIQSLKLHVSTRRLHNRISAYRRRLIQVE